jgi:F-type H+-transporting ATPase subunit gamma
MRFFCLATLLATACAFTSQPAAFIKNSPLVGERAVENVVAPGTSHRNRRATIVMDGKANGEFYNILDFFLNSRA